MIVIAVALALLSCASPGSSRVPQDPIAADDMVPAMRSAETCAAALNRRELDAVNPADAVEPLGSGPIRLLSWNIQKNDEGEAQADLSRFAAGADLVLLQEARQGAVATERLGAAYNHAFAPGYATPSFRTGVVTSSKADPLTRCTLQHVEPWLRSAKATGITQYALQGREEKLLVVNLHLINFTIGVSDMRGQLDEAVQVIAGHHGPVIVCGDFNTWSRARMRVVASTFENLELRSIDFERDRRKRVFGHALDHVYVRGLQVVESASHEVETSDHNPITVVLKLNDVRTIPSPGEDDVTPG